MVERGLPEAVARELVRRGADSVLVLAGARESEHDEQVCEIVSQCVSVGVCSLCWVLFQVWLLVFGYVALVCAVIEVFRTERRAVCWARRERGARRWRCCIGR